MLQLYYSPLSCSLAVHIALEEAKLPHQLHLISTQSGEHLTDSYKKVNPLQRVPALRLQNGTILTEVAAILSFIADLVPQQQLLPTLGLERAQALEWMSFLASQVHPAFITFFRPSRYAKGELAQGAIQEGGRERFHEMLKHIEAKLPGGDTVLKSGPSLVDSHTFVFYLWGAKVKLPVHELKKYTEFVAGMLKRQSVIEALATEGLTDLIEGMGIGRPLTHSTQ